VTQEGKALEEEWLRECRGLYGELPQLTTASGVLIKPVYAPAGATLQETMEALKTAFGYGFVC